MTKNFLSRMRDVSWRSAAVALLGVGLAVGCGTARPTSDSPSSPGPGPGPGPQVPTATLTGRIAMSGVSGVEAAQVQKDGSLLSLGSGRIVGDAFTIDVAADLDAVIVIGLDGNGVPVGEVTCGRTPSVGRSHTCAPMTGETTVETMVYVDLAGCVGLDAIVVADLRARIDADVAASVLGSADLHAHVHALAEAIAAAQLAEVHALVQLGKSVDLHALVQLEAQAEIDLDGELADGVDAATAEAHLWAKIDACLQGLGLDANLRARVEVCAGLALRAVVHARLGKDAVVDACARLALRLEGHSVSLATHAMLDASTLVHTAISLGDSACDQLDAGLHVAVNAGIALGDCDGFRASVCGDGNMTGSVVGALLGGIDLVADALVQATIDLAAQLEAGVEADVHATLSAMAGGPGCPDLDAIAKVCVDAYLGMCSQLDARVGLLSLLGDGAEVTVDLIALAHSFFDLAL